MCGRYGISVSREELKEYLNKNYDIFILDESIKLPRYNISPGQNTISLINNGSNYHVGLLRWGFVPEWAKDENIGYKMINARIESLDLKPAYKKSFYQRRCVIIASGFFEWHRNSSTKTPYYFYLKDKDIFGFAGLWTVYKRKDGSKLYTSTIITKEATSLMKNIHNRMPVILSETEAKQWLDPKIKDRDILMTILQKQSYNNLSLHQVSKRVNQVINDDESIIKSV